MPLATFRSFIGVSKDTAQTFLAAPVIATATSVTVANPAGLTATSTITIIDGVNTETRTATALAGSVLTVPALTNAHAAGAVIIANGTASNAPVDYIPVKTIVPFDKITYLEDKNMRGSAIDVYDEIAGPISSELELAGDAFPDTIGYLLGPLLGDYVFAGGTPNTHTFAVKNSGDGQPNSLSVVDYDGFNARQYPGLKVDEVAFRFNADGLLEYTAKAAGFSSGVITTPTPAFSTVVPLPNWVGVTSIAGASTLTGWALESGDVAIKRPVTPLHAIDGTQQPYKMWSGPVMVSGKLVIIAEDETHFLNYINNTKPALDINWATGSGASALQIKLHMSKCAFTVGKINRGKDFVAIDIDFIAVGNTTDAGASGGYSPIKVTLQNSKVGTLYQ